MKSTIKIDMDGENQPYISVILDPNSEDLRDKMLRRFFEKFGYASNLALVQWVSHLENGKQFITIEPIQPGNLQKEVDSEAMGICTAQATEMSKVIVPQDGFKGYNYNTTLEN